MAKWKDFGYEGVMKFFFLGICGTAMGNAALLLKWLGHEVMGADKDIYPPMSDVLSKAGIPIFEGYDAQRLEQLAPDRVVIGNVISRGNLEVEWLLNTRKIPYCSLPDLLSSEILKDRFNIVVSGTHGKTTTTALIAHLLEKLGKHPGYLIGGVPKGMDSGACLGDNESPFVIEGDEYDSAFFDKRSKFIHYRPSILVINNIEFDHGDIFRDLQDIKRSFGHLLKIVPQNGYLLINGDDAHILELLPINWTTVYKVGTGMENDLKVVNIREDNKGSKFSLFWKGKFWGEVAWGLSGEFNARNAAMAILAVGLTLSPKDPTVIPLNILADFQGVKRRQEVVYENNNLVVIEDFAHHPTALRETLQAFKSRYEGYLIHACFEPRSNTACRRFHQDTFYDALKNADRVFIGPVYRAELYGDNDRLNTELIANQLRSDGIEAKAYERNELILGELENYTVQALSIKAMKDTNTKDKHLVCFFSNGSFDGIINKFVQRVNSITSY